MRVVLWIFAALGALVFLLIVAIGGFGFYAYNKGQALSGEAQAYADDTIEAYSSSGWAPDALIARGAPEFMAEVRKNPNVLEQLAAMIKRHGGELVSVDPAICQAVQLSQTTKGGETVIARCLANGEFEAGPAVFTVTVISRRGEWRLGGFFVNIEVVNQVKKPSIAVSASTRTLPIAPRFAVHAGPSVIALDPQALEISMSSSVGGVMTIGVGAEVETR